MDAMTKETLYNFERIATNWAGGVDAHLARFPAVEDFISHNFPYTYAAVIARRRSTVTPPPALNMRVTTNMLDAFERTAADFSDYAEDYLTICPVLDTTTVLCFPYLHAAVTVYRRSIADAPDAFADLDLDADADLRNLTDTPKENE